MSQFFKPAANLSEAIRLLVAVSFFYASSAAGEVRLTTWNLKHLGRVSQDLPRVAELLTDSDIVLIQEVNTTKSGATTLSKLALLVGGKTGIKFCVALSEVPTDAKERYGVLYREDRISYVTTNGEVLAGCPPYAITLRLGVKGAEKIVREPAVGFFKEKKTGAKFLVSTVHAVPKAKKPEREIPHVFDAAEEVAGKFPVIVGGDFNLSCSHSAFSGALARGFKPAIPCEVKTSLKQKERAYSQPYDNIFVRGGVIKSGSVIDVFSRFEKLSPQEIYKQISDHAPVTVEIEMAP